MRQLPLLISLGLLAACSESASAPDNEAADNVAGTVEDLAGDDMPANEAPAMNDAAEAVVAEAEKPAAEEPDTKEPAAQQRATLASLPLKPGFYVASDTPCAQASNATLMLVTRSGINSSRVPCEFKTIEKTGANSYRVTESCTEGGAAWGTELQVSTNVATYTITGDNAFTSKSEDGWGKNARYCAQTSLPEPWRSNDISG